MSSSEENSSVFSDSDGDVDPELTQPPPKYAPKHKLQGSGDEEKRKRTKWDLKKAPTAEEINVLKESSNLYHSNLFRMQVEEMLKEIAKVQTKHRNYIENWLIDFNKFLMALPAGKEKRSLDDLGWLKKIKLPLDTSFLEETKGTFQFVVPKKSASVVGSQKLGTILGNHLLVDICIEMPKEFFQTSDYLNMIYHRKRALYLCYILKHLKKKSPELGTQQEFMYARGNPLKPILLLTNPEKNKHVTFAIHLACEEITYKLVRFIPLRNNVRSGVIRGTPTSDVESEQCATPHYNSSILEDFVMLRNENFILECFEGKQNVRDAAILLKVWLKQRGLDRGYSGFSGYLITILLAHLLHARKLNSNASSYQIIRILWTYLGESAWNEVGKGAKCMQKSEGDNKPSLEDFHKYFRVVFVDSSGFLNLCATLSEDMYKRIRLEAKIALNLLDNSSVNSFHCLFMASIPLCLQYDHFLSIPHNKDIAEAIQKQSSVADTLNYCTFWYPRLQDEISDILRKGLSSRIIAFCPLPCEVKRWDVQQIPGCSAEDSPLTFGFIVHPQEALDVVVKGPQANEPEAVEFRNFWGEKSQLRRFKDGSITEACIWAPSSSSLTRKRMISRDIVFHLLSHHLEMSEESLRESCTYSGNELNCEITAKEKAKGGKYRDGYDTEMMSLHVIQEFDALGKVLRSLEDLPLEITAVQGTSPIFRYCDPIANFPNGYSAQENDAVLFYGKQIYEGVLQLSLSGKWPDSVVAIEKLKQAFYLELMKKLSKNGIKFTRVSMNGIEILKGGFIFRFQVAHAKELALRKQIIVNGIAKQRDSPESVQFERELFILPRLSSALNGIHQQFNSFGPTVCLAKKWLYSQLFDQHIWPDECTELLVASLYTKPGASLPPFQPQAGFLRFLHLMGSTNWQNELIIVNFNESLTPEEVSKLEGNFQSSRENYPPLTIVTSFDATKHSIWSKSAPILQILVRVSVLAKQLIDTAEKNLLQGIMDVEKHFQKHHFDSFSAIIKVNEREVSFSMSEGQSKRFPVGFNPVKLYLRDLRAAFGTVALFFSNPLKEDFIGVLWKPNIEDSVDFRISALAGHSLRSNGKLWVDREKILKDFEMLGKGLVTEIINFQ